MMKKNVLSLIVIAVLLAGCSSYQPIVYKTEKMAPLSTSIPINVEIHELKDLRKDSTENMQVFTAGRQVKIDKETKCINAEKFYKEGTVSRQITQQIADHFQAVELFQSTVFGENSQADYYITGNLACFYGEQEYSSAAAVGSQFGLIGALATSGVKTEGRTRIEITDIKLHKSTGEVVKEIGSFMNDFSGSLPADGYCWCIYSNMNERLKEFNSGLVKKIRDELKGVEF